MKLFERKPKIVQAEKYHLGLEDGILPGFIVDVGEMPLEYTIPRDTIDMGYPYIIVSSPYNSTKWKFISDNDWIIINEDGTKDVMGDGEFKANFFPMEDKK